MVTCENVGLWQKLCVNLQQWARHWVLLRSGHPLPKTELENWNLPLPTKWFWTQLLHLLMVFHRDIVQRRKSPSNNLLFGPPTCHQLISRPDIHRSMSCHWHMFISSYVLFQYLIVLLFNLKTNNGCVRYFILNYFLYNIFMKWIILIY